MFHWSLGGTWVSILLGLTFGGCLGNTIIVVSKQFKLIKELESKSVVSGQWRGRLGRGLKNISLLGAATLIAGFGVTA